MSIILCNHLPTNLLFNPCVQPFPFNQHPIPPTLSLNSFFFATCLPPAIFFLQLSSIFNWFLALFPPPPLFFLDQMCCLPTAHLGGELCRGSGVPSSRYSVYVIFITYCTYAALCISVWNISFLLGQTCCQYINLHTNEEEREMNAARPRDRLYILQLGVHAIWHYIQFTRNRII